MDEIYTESQVLAILNHIGIKTVGETDTNILCLCPFHSNKDTPSFSISKTGGLFLCFSPSCDAKGTLLQLIMKITNKNIYAAKRIIEKYYIYQDTLKKEVENLLDKKNELPVFSQDIINKMNKRFWNSPAHEYMIGRGFTDATLGHFEIGYSVNKQMVAVPVHDWTGNPVGVVGRKLTEKRFKNSDNLPTGKILFNAHRARQHSQTVIIVESSMDAMKLHQCGFPNVVATLGGFFTNWHTQIINKYFNNIIIMTDFDNPNNHINQICKKCSNNCKGHNPGRALGEKIITNLPGKKIFWASYDYHIVYPNGSKDAGDMTKEEIKQCIKNAVSVTEYEFWKHEVPELALI